MKVPEEQQGRDRHRLDRVEPEAPLKSQKSAHAFDDAVPSLARDATIIKRWAVKRYHDDYWAARIAHGPGNLGCDRMMISGLEPDWRPPTIRYVLCRRAGE